MEITLSDTLRKFESLLPKADRETIAKVLENLADRDILRRREGVEPTYVLALSNTEWAKRWVTGSVEVDKKWQILCQVRYMDSIPEVREMAMKIRKNLFKALEE